MAEPNTMLSFKCRKCRHLLFSFENLLLSHAQLPQCSSWYLKDDDMLPWIQNLVDESGWTEGKLYCPKCNARVGGFDFLHMVQCSCLVDVIPAIWCPKSRVDIASKAIYRLPHGQAMGAECSRKSSNETSQNDKSIKEQSNGDAVDATTGDEHSIVDTACDTKMQSTVAKVLRNSASTHRGTLCEAKHLNASNITNQNTDSMEVSHCSDCNLASKVLVFNDSSIELKHVQHCHSCIARATLASCCGSNVPSCNDYSADDSYISVGNIQEGLKEIRREVENLYPSLSCDGNSRSREVTGRRRKKPRRRGRCNWQHETDYFAYMKEIKERKCPIDSEMHDEISISKHKLKEFSKNCEKEKELSDSEIPDCYKCSVCLSLLHDPHKTPCQHVFCALCIRQLNHVSRGRPNCPLCREPIRDVEEEEDLAAEIQISFPANYRLRTKEAKRNRHRKSALPTPNSTRFDLPLAEENQGNHFGLIQHVTIIALAVSLLINGLLVNNRGNPIVRANFQRYIALFVLIVIGCMFVSLFFLCLVLFAFDFVKIALLLVLSYVAVIKLALGTILD